MYAQKEHSHRSDEVAHHALEAYEQGKFGHQRTRGLTMAWRMVTGSQPVSNGKPTPALKNAAERWRKREGWSLSS